MVGAIGPKSPLRKLIFIRRDIIAVACIRLLYEVGDVDYAVLYNCRRGRHKWQLQRVKEATMLRCLMIQD